MNFIVNWDNPTHTIIRHDITPGWTWQAFRDAKRIADMMIDSMENPQPVGVIFVLPDEMRLPPNSIINTRAAIVNRHPRAAVLALVARSNHIKNFYDILVKVYPPTEHVCILCPTVEDARKKIQEHLNMMHAANGY